MIVQSSLAFLVVAFQLASAAKDNDYYFPGFVNPNTDYKMYWKDSVNVLQDLDQFESLYIRYHHCVWSKYGTMYGSGQNYDQQGNDQDDFEETNGCGGWGGENFWYMGRTQCFKANAAYSLYGVLKGESGEQKRGSYCHKESYINSFFTMYGVESFAGPLGIGVDTANSYCTSTSGNGNNDGSGDGDDAGYDDAKADDDYVGDDYTFYHFDDYTSTGTGCSAQGEFVTDYYNGAFCQGRKFNSTLDQLKEFNEALQAHECTQIYSSSGYQNDDEDRRGRRRTEDEQQYDFESMNPLQILSFSKTCSLSQYPKDCPDPFHKKATYAKNIQSALAYKTGGMRDWGEQTLRTFSWIFFAAAIAFVAAAVYVNPRSGRGKIHAKLTKKLRKLRKWGKKGKRKPKIKPESLVPPGSSLDEGGKGASTSTSSSPSPPNSQRKTKRKGRSSKKRPSRNRSRSLPRVLGLFRQSDKPPSERTTGTNANAGEEVELGDYQLASEASNRGKLSSDHDEEQPPSLQNSSSRSFLPAYWGDTSLKDEPSAGEPSAGASTLTDDNESDQIPTEMTIVSVDDKEDKKKRGSFFGKLRNSSLKPFGKPSSKRDAGAGKASIVRSKSFSKRKSTSNSAELESGRRKLLRSLSLGGRKKKRGSQEEPIDLTQPENADGAPADPPQLTDIIHILFAEVDKEQPSEMPPPGKDEVAKEGSVYSL